MAYASVRAGLIGFKKSLIEMVAPGFIKPDMPTVLKKKNIQMVQPNIPRGQAREPEEGQLFAYVRR